MRICSDNHIACNCKTLFRKERMLNSHLSYIKIIGDIVATGKFTNTFTVLSRLNILIRNKVIHYQCNFIFVKYGIYCHLIHLMNRNRRCDIITKYKIQICLNKLSCLNLVKTCMSSKNLLCHCHSHLYLPSFQTII